MIYIIRHGQTDQNKNGLLLGRTDAPLNDRGRMEAEEAGEDFKRQGITFDVCYSSPLCRAVETARIVTGFPESGIMIDDHLIEMDYGPYEGISLHDPPREIVTFFSDFIHNPAPEGMEQLSHVTERMGEFLEKLPYKDGQNILLSTHAIAMKGALEYLTPDSHGSYWNKYIRTCAVYCFDRKEGKYTVPVEFKYSAKR